MSRNLYFPVIFLTFFMLLSQDVMGQAQFLKKGRISRVPERGLVIQAGAGIAAIKSDICGSWRCNDFGPYLGIGALYKFTPYIAVSTELNYQRLGAEEKTPKLNLAFQSEVTEISSMLVVNLLDSYSGSGNYRSSRKRFVVPYVKAGGGIVYYTATSFPADGKLNESQTTYDREIDYPALAPVIAFGGGLRFRLNDEISIAPEMVYHMTTTDHLDNIGPRLGSAQYKDDYGVGAVKILYTPVVKNNIFSKKSQQAK